jgi:hypothetical protein
MDAAAKTLHATHEKNLAKWNKSHSRPSQMTLQALASESAEPAWVLARIKDDAPLAKWKPRWAGPFRLLDFKNGTESVVRLYDTIRHTVIESHVNDVALWDARFVNSTEGITAVAETDNWSYPIDGIMGIALEPESEDHPWLYPSHVQGRYQTNTNTCSQLNGKATLSPLGSRTLQSKTHPSLSYLQMLIPCSNSINKRAVRAQNCV